jgi:hypothetical protein
MKRESQPDLKQMMPGQYDSCCPEMCHQAAQQAVMIHLLGLLCLAERLLKGIKQEPIRAKGRTQNAVLDR